MEIAKKTHLNAEIGGVQFERDMLGFKEMFSRYLRARNQVIDWEKIKPPPAEMVLPYENLLKCTPEERIELSKKLCVLKLNGGLGTTMGCKGPKSVIEVRGEKTFLDLTVEQIEVSSYVSLSIRFR